MQLKSIIWFSFTLLLTTGCINSTTIQNQDEADMSMSLQDCAFNGDCPAGSYCDSCAKASCSSCQDCVPGCQPVCESEAATECDLERPNCEDNEVSVIRDGCWLCVNQMTCEPSFIDQEPNCTSNPDCSLGQYCDQCAMSSCPDCEDCVALCQPSACESEEVADCELERPICAESEVLVIRDGCWQCIDQMACEASQTQLTTCTSNADCEVGSYCEECATSSCPSCRDCIGLCTVSSCESEEVAVCEIEPPSCESGTVLIIQDGCWLCVDQSSCEAMSVEPPLTTCGTNNDCPFGSICDPCAGSSCPECDDCVSACRSVCDSEEEALCNTVQPECDDSQVLIVKDRCWLCVDPNTCEP